MTENSAFLIQTVNEVVFKIILIKTYPKSVLEVSFDFGQHFISRPQSGVVRVLVYAF